MPIVRSGVLRFQKTFQIGEWAVVDEASPGTLRLPIGAPRGTRVFVEVRHAGEITKHIHTAEGAASLEWISVSLNNINWVKTKDGKRRAVVDVSISPQGGGLLLYFDERRDYGRTKFLDRQGQARAAGKELAAELITR